MDDGQRKIKRRRHVRNKKIKIKMHPDRPDGRVNNGGARPGAGRPSTGGRAVMEAIGFKEKFPILPLHHMLSVLNGIDPKTGQPLKKVSDARKDQMAKDAAPYIHPRLSAIAVQGRLKWSVDPRKLSDEELVVFERLLLKAQSTQELDSKSMEAVGQLIDAEYEEVKSNGNGNGS